MTRIKGEIIKTGYSQPVVTQQTNFRVINTGLIAPGTHTFALSNPPAGKTITVKKISASADDNTAMHEIILTRNSINIFDVYFNVVVSPVTEWTPEIEISFPSIWAVSVINNAAGNREFTINVYWIES